MIEALKAHAVGHIEKHKLNVEVILKMQLVLVNMVMFLPKQKKN